MKSKNLKFVAAFAAFFLLFNQVIPASYASVVSQTPDPLNDQKYTAVTTAEEKEAEQAKEQIQETAAETAIDFLLSQDDAVITPADDEAEDEEKEEVAAAPAAPTAAAQPSTFDQALEYLNNAKGLAIRAIQNLTYENLVQLGRQTWEYGLAVVQGVILLFTSHEENSLSLTAGFKSLLDTTASLVLHKQSVGQTYASLNDIEGAKQRAAARGEEVSSEYVISLDENDLDKVNVVKFDNLDGNPDGQEIVAAGDLIAQIKNYYDPAQSALQSVLNAIEIEETEDPILLELYRTDPPTVFTGLPKLVSFASESPVGSISVNQTSSSNFIATYDISNGSFAGTVINWGATSAGFVNLNGLSQYSFEFKRNNTACGAAGLTCFFVEFKDTSNRVAKVRITNLGTSFVQKDIPKSALLSNNPNIDMTHIKEINFVFDSQTPSTGVLEVNTGGLAFDPSLNPDNTNPAITTVPVDGQGNRPALTGFASADFSSVQVSPTSKSTGSLTINQFAPASFGGAFVLYDNLATTNTVEFINFSTSFPSGLVLELNDGGTGVSEAKLELTDNTNKKDFVRLKQIGASGKRWKILSSNFDEIDVTKIQSIAIVTEGQLLNKTLNYSWGDFAFVPQLAFDNTNPATTPFPATSTGERAVFTGFASNDFSSSVVTTASTTFATVDLNLYNGTSFGGAFLNYDNLATTATVESINLQSLFPNGFVLQLDNANTGVTQVKLELTDALGNRDEILLTGIEQFGKKFKILTSNANTLFDEVDLTKISTISLVVEGQAVGKKLNVDWGSFNYVPQIPEDGSNPAVTPVPATSTGERVTAAGFASADFSSTTVTQASTTFTTLDFNHFNSTSFGGMFLNYDNLATTATTESINLQSLFPNGLVFQLDNGGTGLTKVKFEITDINGNRDEVVLTGIAATGKKFKLLTSNANTPFDEVDLTKVVVMSIVAEGQNIGKKLNIDWGNFAYVPTVTEDGSNPAITQLPVTSTGERVALSGFASNDFSSSTVTAASTTFATVDLNLYNSNSFGGAFLNYDNLATTATVESINLQSLFPNGLVLQLDNGGTGLTKIKVELTDINGNRDEIYLDGIAATGKKFKLLTSNANTPFDEVDLTKISTISLVVEGQAVGKKLNVDWGNFAFVPQIPEDGSNPAVTPVPATSTGERVTAAGFASADFSSTTVTQASTTFTTLDFNHFNSTSFGGMFLNYDNLATTATTESINLQSLFPNGLVFQLDNGGTGLTKVKFEITDINGNRDEVVLTGIAATGKKFKLLTSNANTPFDEVDLTKVVVMSIVAEGQNIGKKLNIDWGNFAYVPTVTEDGSNPAITQLPLNSQGDRIVLTGFASNDFSSSKVTTASPTFATVDLNLYNGTSFGGLFINYDNLATTTTTESINLQSVFPNGVVLQIDNGGTGLTKVKVELTDINGNRDEIYLDGIAATGKKFKLLTSNANTPFDEVDLTKIAVISIVAEGQHIGRKLNIDWGIHDHVPAIPVDGSNPAITPIPTDSLGQRPILTGFASLDFSGATVNQTSATSGNIDFDLYNSTSFGGAFFSYDNLATTNVIETINLNTAFPNGIVLQLSSSAITSAILEITDINGNRDEVKLDGITSSNGRWKVLISNFDQADVSQIQTISLVVTGQHVDQTLNYSWGNFAFVPSISSDPANPSITTLPNSSTGQPAELVGFASSGSSVQADVPTGTEATLTFNLTNANAFGGAFLNYDNPSTTSTVETINLQSLFPSGMVLGMDNAGTALNAVFLEVTDNTGKRDRVRLTDILNTAKRWNIPVGAFDEIDTTKVRSIAFVLEGQVTGLKLHLNWGNWQFVPEI